MASLDSSLSEADRMAQGACDGAETTRPDYAFSGGFIGSGPDSARQDKFDFYLARVELCRDALHMCRIPLHRQAMSYIISLQYDFTKAVLNKFGTISSHMTHRKHAECALPSTMSLHVLHGCRVAGSII